ncbi:hypothetical protein FACS1894104_1670 [Actinomycetota bacterium]|nr:hypothetical protein FACS1894104_1670 [Actinomycetota bacterium]
MVKKTALMRMVVDEIVRRNNVSYDLAIDQLYRSKLLEDLQDPSSNTLITWSASDLVDEMNISS